MFFRNGLKVNVINTGLIFYYFKVILSTLFILLVLCNILKASDTKGIVDVYHNNKIQFSMTYDEFNLILQSANIYYKIIDAEKNNRVIIELKNNPWTLSNQKYITEAYIVWLDKNNNQIKKITVEIKLNPAETKSFGNEYYNMVSNVGFPIMTILVLLLIIF